MADFPEGRLAVSWAVQTVGKTEEIRIEWNESCGPIVKKPSKQGFGNKLIDRSCSFELRGTAELKFEPSGLTAEIRFPLG